MVHNLTNQQTKKEKKGVMQETMNMTAPVGLLLCLSFSKFTPYRLPLWKGRVGR